MQISVYLHDEVYSVLKCFGTLDKVVNDILDAVSAGEIELMDKPAAPTRSGAGRYNVNVSNEDYISLIRQMGAKSTRISLRRLLYWFVEEEVYELLGWEMTEDYVDVNDTRTKKRIEALKQQALDLRDRSSVKYYDPLSAIVKILEELQ